MKITIDETAWNARDQIRSVTKADDLDPPQFLFVLKGRSDVVPAVISGDSIEIFPERSASQKALREALGA